MDGWGRHVITFTAAVAVAVAVERERTAATSLLSLHHYFMFVLLAQIRAEQQCAHSIELINHLSQQHARAMQVTRGGHPGLQ